ncbi:hypothetical protein [Adhaeribacter radiodurans]|uniref:Uncharacterized protein n=1 Tax=Adhaeribacter radiodurans TaxID=2745197 RepID=A0A7L7L5P4_9BACT|nr:hypothetical protein [Adhaeribacter radiodurans]QMU28126.1 hypothetical protein HUW48_08730 [Adhaeribacter radiodurans]
MDKTYNGDDLPAEESELIMYTGLTKAENYQHFFKTKDLTETVYEKAYDIINNKGSDIEALKSKKRELKQVVAKHELFLIKNNTTLDWRVSDEIYGQYEIWVKDLIHRCKALIKVVNVTLPSIKKRLILKPNAQLSLSIEQPETNYDEILLEIRGAENQFWKGLPMEGVIKHFEIMTKKKSKNGEVFLTNEQLLSFLKKGFLNDANQPMQKINCTTTEKGFIIKRFYELFDLAVSQYAYPMNKKNRFINLFTDCFDNWDAKTIPTFFKPGRTKEKW